MDFSIYAHCSALMGKKLRLGPPALTSPRCSAPAAPSLPPHRQSEPSLGRACPATALPAHSTEIRIAPESLVRPHGHNHSSLNRKPAPTMHKANNDQFVVRRCSAGAAK